MTRAANKSKKKTGIPPGTRCAAASAGDPDDCTTVPDAVVIYTMDNAEVTACVHHGALLLRQLFRLGGGRVYPWRGPVGSALRCYVRAVGPLR